MNSILDELYNLLNEADESFGLNEKITTKQALRRKRRAIKKAKQKAAKKQAQQTDTQDQTKYLPATIEHLIKPDEKQAQDEQQFTQEFEKLREAFFNLFMSCKRDWEDLQKVWGKLGRTSQCPPQFIEQAKNYIQTYKQGLETLTQQVEEVQDKLLPEELQMISYAIDVMAGTLNRGNELVAGLTPGEYADQLDSREIDKLAAEQTKLLTTAKDKFPTRTARNRKQDKAVTYEDWLKSTQKMSAIFTQGETFFDKLKNIHIKKLLAQAWTVGEWITDKFAQLLNNPVAKGMIQTIMYSNPVTAMIFDGKLGSLNLFDGKNVTKKMRDTASKAAKGKVKLDDRHLPTNLKTCTVKELNKYFFTNLHFINLVDACYNHTQVDMKDKTNLSRLIKQLYKLFKEWQKDKSAPVRDDVLKYFSQLIVLLNKICDYLKWNNPNDWWSYVKLFNKRKDTNKDKDKIEKASNKKTSKEDERDSDNNAFNQLTAEQQKLVTQMANQIVQQTNNQQESYNENYNMLEEAEEIQMKLKDINQITPDGIVVFMPSGIQATLYDDGENIVVEYPELYKDVYTKKQFSNLVDEGIHILNPNPTIAQQSALMETTDVLSVLCEKGYIRESLMKELSETNWQLQDSDEDELEQETKEDKYILGQQGHKNILVKAKDSEEAIKKAGFGFKPDRIFNSPEECNIEYEKLIEGYDMEKQPAGTVFTAQKEKDIEFLTPDFKNDLLTKLVKISKDYPNVKVRQQAVTFMDELGLQEYNKTDKIKEFADKYFDIITPKYEALEEVDDIADELENGNKSGDGWICNTSWDDTWEALTDNAKLYILEKIAMPVRDGYDSYTDLELVIHDGSGLKEVDLESMDVFDEIQIDNILNQGGEEVAYITYEINFYNNESFKIKDKKKKKKKLDEFTKDIKEEEQMKIKEAMYVLDQNIKSWYANKYPNDDMGQEIKDSVTFTDVKKALKDHENVYDILGVNDSVIRERVFNFMNQFEPQDIHNVWVAAHESFNEECYKIYNAINPEEVPLTLDNWDEVDEYLNRAWGEYKASMAKENDKFGSDEDKDLFMAGFEIAVEPNEIDVDIEDKEEVCPDCKKEPCECEGEECETEACDSEECEEPCEAEACEEEPKFVSEDLEEDIIEDPQLDQEEDVELKIEEKEPEEDKEDDKDVEEIDTAEEAKQAIEDIEDAIDDLEDFIKTLLDAEADDVEDKENEEDAEPIEEMCMQKLPDPKEMKKDKKEKEEDKKKNEDIENKRYIVSIQLGKDDWDEQAFERIDQAVQAFNQLKPDKYSELMDAKTDEILLTNGQLQEDFEDGMSDMLTNIKDLDFPDALHGTVDVKDDGSIYKLSDLAKEFEELKASLQNEIQDIKNDIKLALQDTKQTLQQDVNNVENKVQDTKSAVDNLAVDNEEDLEDIEFEDEEPAAEEEPTEETEEAPVEEEQEEQVEEALQNNIIARHVKSIVESAPNKTISKKELLEKLGGKGVDVTLGGVLQLINGIISLLKLDDNVLSDEQVEADNKKDFAKYLKTGCLEDLTATKQKIDQMVSQKKSAEDIKNAITILSDTEDEKDQAQEYAADKLQESLLESVNTSLLGHLFQNPGLNIK